MRRGITLVELVLVLALLSILAGFGLPAAGRLRDAVAADRAAQAIVGAHRVARFSAILRNRRTLVVVRPESLAVRALGGADTLTLWVREGPAADGVALAGPTYALVFAPTGIPLGAANATFLLTRGSVTRRVIISRLGRTRIVRQ